MKTDGQNDTFVKWMLTATASIVVVMIAGIFTSILELKEDMSAIKVEIKSVSSEVSTIQAIRTKVEEHDIRIRWIENGSIDNKSPDAVYDTWDGKRDTTHPFTFSP